MKEIHFEKEEYPGGFQVESLCGVKAVFRTEGDCMVTAKDMRDYLRYSKLSVEEIITCSKCRELYLKEKSGKLKKRRWDISIWPRTWKFHVHKKFGRSSPFLFETWIGPICFRTWSNRKSACNKIVRIVQDG